MKNPQFPVTALVTIKDGQARIASDATIWPAARVVVGAELKGEIPWYVVEVQPERRHCGKCHECGTILRSVLDGEEWCPTCQQYRRYRTHGFTPIHHDGDDSDCPRYARAIPVFPEIPSADYQEAARRYLTPEAAARYCAGDMTATDDIGHEAIMEIASEVAAERNET